jgi:hypothetical protein
MDHRQEVDSELLESGRDTTAFLEPAVALLDCTAAAIGAPVKADASVVRVLVFASRDDRADRMSTQPTADTVGAVALVAREGHGTAASTDVDPVHDRFELRALVDLARGDVDREGYSVTFSNQVDLAPESAARAAQSVVVGLTGAPLFPAPAAAFEARTDVPSTHQRSQSIWPSASSRICRAFSTRSNTPSRREELKCV